ncbi:hypothetical protein BCO26_0484 [Heyndrickxia coagulans 2-6]|nr:hypothetical protein BCO26_0484 [Heyndrickxia coagulans 2-6]
MLKLMGERRIRFGYIFGCPRPHKRVCVNIKDFRLVGSVGIKKVKRVKIAGYISARAVKPVLDVITKNIHFPITINIGRHAEISRIERINTVVKFFSKLCSLGAVQLVVVYPDIRMRPAV